MSGALALTLAAALATPSAAEGPGPSIRWEPDPSGRAAVVAVVGLPPGDLAALRAPNWTPARWPGLLAVTLDREGDAGTDRPAMLGAYRVEGDILRFIPRYPLDRGRRYRATFRPTALPGTHPVAPEVTSTHLVPKPDRRPTALIRVDPQGDRLPENLLKFYLHFSAPMGRGEAYDRVRLLKEDGEPVDLPFLRLGEELWDPTGTRLTLLIDPGRIKRGLRPREEHGPVLEAGRSYTLVVDPAWRDAEGDPLAAEARKPFRAGPPDEVQPDPQTWTLGPPAAGTREPLTLGFPEALDAALVETALAVVDPRGRPVEGRGEAVAGATRWRFTPEAPWAEGEHQVLAGDHLEDLAGNSISRPFEVDVRRDTPARPEPGVVRIPVAIRPRAR